MKNYKNSVVLKGLVVVAILVGVLAMPSNSSLIFGYGSTTPAVTPKCKNQKPGSAPALLSAYPSGKNSVTLNWARASDPVTYYLVTYGRNPGEMLYGNPNVGNSTSYTVNMLSGGQRYFFRVRAGNGCMPGDFSNELSAVANGQYYGNNFFYKNFNNMRYGVWGQETEVVNVVSPTPTPKSVTPSPIRVEIKSNIEMVEPKTKGKLNFIQRIVVYIFGLEGKY